METKVTFEVASAEVNGWLDYKKVSDKKRETYKDAIEALTDAVVTGRLVIDADTKAITQVLLFPITDTKGTVVTDKLVFKPRITQMELKNRMTGVKPGDGDGRIMAYAAALTDSAAGILGKLDTEDYALVQSITVFFLG